MAVWPFGGVFAEKEGCDDSFFFSDPKANERVNNSPCFMAQKFALARRLVKVSVYPD